MELKRSFLIDIFRIITNLKIIAKQLKKWKVALFSFIQWQVYISRIQMWIGKSWIGKFYSLGNMGT